MYDVIIIGGGIVGASLGRELSKYKLKTCILEKNLEVCQETTKANSAIVHGGYDCEPGTLKATLNVRGNYLMEDLSKELGFTYRKIGSMVLAFNDEEIEELHRLYDKGIKNGVRGMEIVDRKKIFEIEPKISQDVKMALYCSESGIIDPFNYCYAMVENSIDNGLDLFTETEVIDLTKEKDGILVKTDKKNYKAKYVVNAAGLMSDKIANMAGDEDFYIIPTKGVYRLLDKNKDNNIKTVLFQTPSKKGKGVLVTATYDGNTMIGPTSEKVDSVEDTSTDVKSLEILDRLGKKSVPSIDIKKTIRVFTGVRAKPNTGDFMIYPSSRMKGLIHSGGIESPGLVSAPAIAEYIVKLLAKEGLRLEKNPNFNPIRKSFNRISQMNDDEKKKVIEKNPKYGNIICRCELVSEAEIIDAIRRPGGARTIDGVKRRVRAGMGRCQGGFCGPRVLEILSRELNVEPTEVMKELSGSEIVEKYLKA